MAADSFAASSTSALQQGGRRMLVCRAGGCSIALPLTHVSETMRPLPVRRLEGTPPFVAGLSVIRGAPTPVVDAAGLIGGQPGDVSRFVTIRCGDRIVALAVERVLGITTISEDALGGLPPLVRAAAAGAVEAISVLDAELLLLLQAAVVLPADAWAALEPGATEAGA